MKKITTIIIVAIAFLFAQETSAQSLKEIMRQKKEEMAAKAKWKADQKVSNGMDKVLDAPEEAIKKKKDKKNKSKDKAAASEGQTAGAATEEAPSSTGSGLSTKGTQTVIQTNITCESGRKKVEALLKKQDGVFDAKINKENGEVAIDYSSDGTSYSNLLKVITDAGFEADGSKPAKSGNPCKN